METDKVNAPAVSQLAGEIARKIFPNPHDKKHAWFDHGRVERQQENAAEIISAALSERERKVQALVEAANGVLNFAARPDNPVRSVLEFRRIQGILRAALSDIKESK